MNADFFWDQLLAYIEEGTVVPIVGEDVLRTEVGGNEVSLHEHLAGLLANRLGVAASESLNDVACAALAAGRRRDDIYSALRQVTPLDLPVPNALTQLARIDRFQLFVSTTFDSMLETALANERHEQPRVLAYSPERPNDLPPGWSQSATTTVFHLFGRLSPDPSYVVTEEDTLEFVHALQSENRHPKQLIGTLKNAHLLLLGCRLDDWLRRFFLRATVCERLSLARGTDYLADGRLLANERALHFLRSFSHRTKIFEHGGAVEFVNELSDRWAARCSDASHPPLSPPVEEDSEIPRDVVFLSYCSEDLDQAKRLQSVFVHKGIELWFDKRQLEWGDQWEPKIKRGIQRCSVFVPLISRRTLTPERRYFRTEWDLAIAESKKARPDMRFLLPVIIDDTDPGDVGLPPKFHAVQHERVESQQDIEALAESLKQIVRDYHRNKRSVRP